MIEFSLVLWVLALTLHSWKLHRRQQHLRKLIEWNEIALGGMQSSYGELVQSLGERVFKLEDEVRKDV